MMPISRLDWIVMSFYALALLGLGLVAARRAKNSSDYFASGRSLPWWIAGTSMIAASFASDTPLLVTGYVRAQGVWGNWAWWALGISTVLSTFVFSRLWHRSGVLTETELSEVRYGGPNAALLRGFKAVFWGLLYASFAAGAGAMTGFSQVVETALGEGSRIPAVLLCAVLAAGYVIASGLWGVVATDVFQFAAAVVGSLATAFFAVRAAGGMDAVLAATHPSLLPPATGIGPSGGFWDSPLAWILSFGCLQWWAWKNADGGGVLVQRMAACRDERHAVGATLWYSVGHYALRAWPWVVAALASLLLVPAGTIRDEAAYPWMVLHVLPAGVRGFVLAWFLAEFMTGMAQFANFGASLLVHDGWKRFVKPGATDSEVVAMARWASVLVIAGAVGTAFFTTSVRDGFETILKLTAGFGTVSLARWLWWRVNAAGEIAAILVSVPALWTAPRAAGLLGISPGSVFVQTLFITAVSVAAWLGAVLSTPPEDMDRLVEFYRKVRPPRWGWGPVAREAGEVVREPWGRALLHWGMGTAGIYAALFGMGGLVLGGDRVPAAASLAAGAGVLVFLVRVVRA